MHIARILTRIPKLALRKDALIPGASLESCYEKLARNRYNNDLEKAQYQFSCICEKTS